MAVNPIYTLDDFIVSEWTPAPDPTVPLDVGHVQSIYNNLVANEMKEKKVEKKKPKELKFIRYFEGFHKQLKRADGRYGLEVETETKSIGSYPPGFLQNAIDPNSGASYWETPLTYWKAVKDGSLRNFGVEYVFKKPLSFQDVKKALEEFVIKTKDVKFLSGEVGTSTHVHMNIQNETLLFLGNLLTLLLLFENLLVEYSGETRRANLFALPTRAAEGNLFEMMKVFKGLEKGSLNSIYLNEENCKYAAINLHNLSKLGSVEIRSFRGTTDMGEVLNWISLLNRIYEAARAHEYTPRVIIDRVRTHPSTLFEEVFGALGSLLRGRDFERLLLSENISGNLFYASQLANCVDWGNLDQRVWKAVDDRESGKSPISERLVAYARRYGGAPEDYAFTVQGEIVMAHDPRAAGQSDQRTTPSPFPYPREGNEQEVPADQEITFDEDDEFYEEEE